MEKARIKPEIGEVGVVGGLIAEGANLTPSIEPFELLLEGDL